MRRLGYIFVLCLTFTTARAQFVEHFDDGDFTENPEWIGDVYSFAVNPYKQLQLHVDAATTSWLATPSKAAIEAQWSFDCYLSCNTSAYNLIRVYLSSDRPDPTSCNGYYVQIGGANKNITLCRQTEEKTEYLIADPDRKLILDDMAESRVHVVVTRTKEGYFTLSSMVETRDDDFVTEGSAFAQYVTGEWFAIWVKNSAKNGTAFTIDNIEVTGLEQISPLSEPTFGQLHSDDVVQLAYKTFSPDGDGYRDLCELTYKMPTPGYHASVTVFTPSGIQVREVAKDLLLDDEGVLTWDGTADNGILLDSGAYVLLFEAWNNDNGTHVRKKLTVALVRG